MTRKSAEPPRFDVATLRRLAGDKVFARGEAYHRDGRVEILAADSGRVLARVSGGEDYRTELVGAGIRIGGACDCPAFADWGFCKHLVATALAANAAGTEGVAAPEPPLERIRRHLQNLDIDTLVSILVDLAERDPVLQRRLDLTSAVADEDDAALERRIRKAIDAATRTRGFVDYERVPRWASGVESVLDAIADLAEGPRAALALPLIGRALARIESALNEVDDSDGRVGGLLERSRDIHLAACRAIRPEPLALASDLFEREMTGSWGTFYGAAHLYAEVLGEAGLSEYRRLAGAAWETIPSCHAGRRTTDEHAVERRRLAGMLDFFAERDGDVAARIALRARDLSSPWQYLELARFCAEQGRAAEALRWAEDGLWQFEDDRPDRRLVAFTVDLLRRAGRDSESLELLWRSFTRAPDLDLYRQLREAGGAETRDRALEFLRNDLSGSRPRARPRGTADLLIQALTEEAMFAEAWTMARGHDPSEHVVDSLALASEATHPAEALTAHAAHVERLVSAGGNANYAAAYNLLVRMARLRPASAQAAHVADLKARFRAKRNFMKLLRDGDCGVPHGDPKP